MGWSRPALTTSRRRLLARALAMCAGVPFVGAFASLVSARHRGRAPRRVRVVPDFRDAVVFADGVIACRQPDSTVMTFSAACTHLGCRISRVDAGMLVCPCHGSRFHLDGRVAAGPASTPLVELPHLVDEKTGELIVDVS